VPVLRPTGRKEPSNGVINSKTNQYDPLISSLYSIYRAIANDVRDYIN
jgi:hypothetical protein